MRYVEYADSFYYLMITSKATKWGLACQHSEETPSYGRTGGELLGCYKEIQTASTTGISYTRGTDLWKCY